LNIEKEKCENSSRKISQQSDHYGEEEKGRRTYKSCEKYTHNSLAKADCKLQLTNVLLHGGKNSCRSGAVEFRFLEVSEEVMQIQTSCSWWQVLKKILACSCSSGQKKTQQWGSSQSCCFGWV